LGMHMQNFGQFLALCCLLIPVGGGWCSAELCIGPAAMCRTLCQAGQTRCLSPTQRTCTTCSKVRTRCHCGLSPSYTVRSGAGSGECWAVLKLKLMMRGSGAPCKCVCLASCSWWALLSGGLSNAQAVSTGLLHTSKQFVACSSDAQHMAPAEQPFRAPGCCLS
jgi:hypothetical protein